MAETETERDRDRQTERQMDREEDTLSDIQAGAPVETDNQRPDN